MSTHPLLVLTWQKSGTPYHNNPYIYFHTCQLILWQQHLLTVAALNLPFVPTASQFACLLQLNICPP